MRLLADECISRTLVRMLRQKGFDIESVTDLATGATDEVVLARSVEMGRVLLTEDYDFARLVFQLKRRAFGIIVIAPELAEKLSGDIAVVIAKRLRNSPDSFSGKLTIFEPDKTRQRVLPDLSSEMRILKN